jgi:hypothetical protein
MKLRNCQVFEQAVKLIMMTTFSLSGKLKPQQLPNGRSYQWSRGMLSSESLLSPIVARQHPMVLPLL